MAETHRLDLPKKLMESAGVQEKDKIIYATGMAKAEKIRADKAFEIARKQSLLRAMQMVQLFAGCSRERLNISETEYQTFLLLFAPMISQSQISGLQVLRQWESDDTSYTAVAAPADAIDEQQCPFNSMDQAIEQYLSSGGPSLEGLKFCLGHTSRYTVRFREILTKIDNLFRQNNMERIAACFDGRYPRRADPTPIEDIATENRIHRASQLVERARVFAKKGQWANAINSVSSALELVPTYGPAFLLVADYFDRFDHSIDLAVMAAKAALRSGTVTIEALTKLVTCLESVSDPEAQVFKYILNESKPIKDGDLSSWADPLPITWLHELVRFNNDPLVSLVMVSLGNAVIGQSLPPAHEFQLAVDRFNRSESEQDIKSVIDLLMVACRNQPISAETYNLMGACFRHLKKPEVALPFFWQALNLKPGYDLALVNLGLCCQELGLVKAAAFYFEQPAVRKSPSKWVQESYARFHENSKRKN